VVQHAELRQSRKTKALAFAGGLRWRLRNSTQGVSTRRMGKAAGRERVRRRAHHHSYPE
jgi:hypothetical protein